MDWFSDWYPMPMQRAEIDMLRMKAYLSFQEEKTIAGKTDFKPASYTNKLGDKILCTVLVERDNGEIVVRNEKGCLVCLTEDSITWE